MHIYLLCIHLANWIDRHCVRVTLDYHIQLHCSKTRFQLILYDWLWYLDPVVEYFSISIDQNTGYSK